MILEDLITFHSFILLCFVQKLPIEVLFFLSAFFSQNDRMLTSSDLDQRSAKFGSASNSSGWCFLVKFGRCRIATLMNHANF